MESAIDEHAPSTIRWYEGWIPRSHLLKANALITLVWSVAEFTVGMTAAKGSTTKDCMTGIGIALMALDLLGIVTSLTRSYYRLHPRVRDVATDKPDGTTWEAPAAPEVDVESSPIEATSREATLREAAHDGTESVGSALPTPTSVESVERAHIAKATMALLRQQVESDATLEAPVVRLIRVGVLGVEVLLATAIDRSSPGFVSEGGGLVWRLESLDRLATLLAGDGLDDLEDLWALGDDDESTYFVGPGLDDPPFCDQLPSDDASDRHWSFGTGLSLFETAEATILEPFGLHLLRAAESLRTTLSPTDEELPPHDESPAATEEFEAAKDEYNLRAETPEACDLNVLVSVDDLEGDLVEVTQPLEERDQLVPPGKVEVRILREEPDLDGELIGESTAAAVELLAYLVLHGHRATTSRLRDSIGTQKMQNSRSGKTVWSAASAARRAVGADLLPGAAANQMYRLGHEVSCDWLRFCELYRIAKEPGTSRDRCRAALSQALSLVNGLPLGASRRFLWLDAEGVLGEIMRAITDAASMLALLELDYGNPETARAALDQGLMISPCNAELLDFQKRLL